MLGWTVGGFHARGLLGLERTNFPFSSLVCFALADRCPTVQPRKCQETINYTPHTTPQQQLQAQPQAQPQQQLHITSTSTPHQQPQARPAPIAYALLRRPSPEDLPRFRAGVDSGGGGPYSFPTSVCGMGVCYIVVTSKNSHSNVVVFVDLSVL